MLLLFNFISWCCGIFLMWRVPECKASSRKKDISLLSIIIPARNEEHNIGPLLESIKAQDYNGLQIIIIDDQSTDNTYKKVLQDGVLPLSGSPRPKGWNGKAWACWQGAQVADCETLMFLDADVRFEPDALHRIMTTFSESDGLLSIQPYHKVETWREQLSSLLNIMVVAGMGTNTPLGERVVSSGTFGPCIVCKKEDYFRLGGHKTIANKPLDDVALGKLFRDSNIKVRCLVGKGILFFRMYDGTIRNQFEGWKKSFGAGATSTSLLIFIFSLLWISGCFSAFTFLPVSLFRKKSLSNSIPIFSYILFSAQIYWMMHRVGNFKMITAVLYPISLLFFTIVFVSSSIALHLRKNLTWKGRPLIE